MRETIVDTITVTEASLVDSRNGEQWEIRMTVPSMNSKYPVGPCFMPADMARAVKKNEQVRVKLERGRPKNGKEGSDREWDYWWSIAAWGTDEPPTPTPAAPSGGNGATAPAPGNLDQRIAWNSSVNNAVALYGTVGLTQMEDMDSTWLTIISWAERLYAIIVSGPPQQAQEAAESHAEPPEPQQATTGAKVLDAVKTWNTAHPEAIVGQTLLTNALYKIYGIGEPTLKESLARLDDIQARGLASHIENGTLEETIVAIDTEEDRNDLPF